MTDTEDPRLPRVGTPEDRMWSMVKLFFEGLDMGVVVVERATHTILWCSQLATRQLDYAVAEMVGRDLEFLYADAAKLEAAQRRAGAAFDRVGVLRAELRMRRKDGSTFETEQSMNVMFDPARYQIAIRDISARARRPSARWRSPATSCASSRTTCSRYARKNAPASPAGFRRSSVRSSPR